MAQTGVVLAAGFSTRMKSSLPKVLHEICGWPLIYYPIESFKRAGIKKIVVVVGFKKDEVINCLEARYKGLVFVTQKTPSGTADAVKATLPVLEKEVGDVLIGNGDAPLLNPLSIKKLCLVHSKKQAEVTLLSAEFENPPPYGRIIRGSDDQVKKIIEDKDATPEQRQILEVNAGLYCVNIGFLVSTLKKISNTNKKKEFYLPDMVGFSEKAFVLKTSNPDEILGINHRVDLERVRRLVQEEINEAHMLNGVTLVGAQNIHIDHDVTIEEDTTIYSNTSLKGKTSIGKNTVIESHCLIVNSKIKDNCHIKQSSVIEESIIENQACVGPFAHLRPLSHLQEGAKVGNFVELKKTTLGKHSKANHLTYLGDAEIGANVNIGCGVITCNFDGGPHKHKSIVEDDAFVGSDVQLIAPVKIGKGAYVASGSSINKDVPAHALAIAREKQVNKPGYAKKILKAHLKINPLSFEGKVRPQGGERRRRT